jgi:hypothetical protein
LTLTDSGDIVMDARRDTKTVRVDA